MRKKTTPKTPKQKPRPADTLSNTSKKKNQVELTGKDLGKVTGGIIAGTHKRTQRSMRAVGLASVPLRPSRPRSDAAAAV
jgi:hypothetical protein